MTYGASSYDLVRDARRNRFRTPASHAALCAAALVVTTLAGLAFLYAGAPEGIEPLAPTIVRPAASHADAFLASSAFATSSLDPSFTAPVFTAGYAPMAFARSIALRNGFAPRRPPQLADLTPDPVMPPQSPAPPLVALQAASTPQILPVPVARPTFLTATRDARASGRRGMAGEPHDTEAPSVYERLFGGVRPPETAMAYAPPEDGRPGTIGPIQTSTPERYTAVYDISAHTVTLPDGTRLEAHSGVGASKDDPRSVARHMRGATPPAVYDLAPREALFHGVAALRLNPVGGTPYGRLGLLAHTYMLGPRGDSNGCVVFKDYKAFRDAYDHGLIRRLVVVARAN